VSTTEAGRLAAAGKPDSTSSDGVSLQAVNAAAHRLDELSCARIVGNLADIVHAAQKGGQPLGTLNPAAVLVLLDGGVKLGAGTASPHYTAPEKLRGGGLDRRTDVFVLGVMLWEALAHERLFEGTTDEAVKRSVFEQAIRPPSELNANVPAEIDAICKKALARDPSDRYQSAKVMAAEIDAVLGDAGYPESNEQIAAYVAQLLVSEPAPPPRAQVLPAAVAKAASSAAMPRPATATLPQPFMAPRPAPTAVLGSTPPLPGAVAAHEVTPGGEPLPEILEPPLKPIVRAARMPATSAKTEILGSVSMLPEKPALSVTAFAGSGASASPATGTAGTPGAPPAPARARTPSTVPPVTASPATPAAAAAPSIAPVAAPSFAPPAMPAPVAASPAMPAATAAPAFSPTGTAMFVAPARLAAAAPASLPAAGPAAASSSDPKHGLPAPFKPIHPQPPAKPSIANAETIGTPQLPAHLAVLPAPAPVHPAAPPQLGMPPGMTVAPSSAPAPLQSADRGPVELGDERPANPAEIIALPRTDRAATTGSRDVLAGWGWATGSVEAIDEGDDVHDTARAGKRRLMIAIGGSLAVALLIAAAAFAFSGSNKPSDQDAPPGTEKVTAPVTTPAAPAPEPRAAPPSEIMNPSPEPAKPEPAALPPSPEPAKPDPAALPPSPEPAKPDPASVEPARPDPAKAIAAKPEPAKPEPAKAIAAKPEPAKPEPAKVAAAIKAPEVKKPPEIKKPPEVKKPPSKASKQPPPEKLAKATPKAQPLDPYATPAPAPAPAPANKANTDPAAAYKAGLQQYARGDTSGALATLRTSLSSNPTYAPTWRGLGMVYEKQGNKGQARSAFKRYLELASDAGDAGQIRERMDRLGP
jgi:hypothetical protein